MRHTSAVLFLGLVLLADSAPADPGKSFDPRAAYRDLDRAVEELASSGWAEEVETLLDAMTELGRDPEEVTRRREKAEGALRRRGEKAPTPAPRIARLLHRTAAALAESLTGQPEPDRPRLARLVLRLDASVAAAHDVLGHVRRGDAWITAAADSCADGRAAIALAVQNARRLDVPTEVGPAEDEVLRKVHGVGGHLVRSGNVRMTSVHLSPEKTARILRESLRAYSLAVWFHTGVLELSYPPMPQRVVLIGSQVDYERAAHLLLDPAEAVERAEEMCFDLGRDVRVEEARTEGRTECSNLLSLYWTYCKKTLKLDPQPCLEAGLMNWISLAYLGTNMPPIVYEEPGAAAGASGRTVTPQEIEEAKEMRRLAQAGIAGSRSYLAWLARRRADPPWSAAMQPQLGMISGVELIKATFVFEYLAQAGEFSRLVRETRGSGGAPAVTAERFEKALGTSLADFEARWRDWLLPLPPGVVQTVDAGPAPPEDSAAEAALAAMRSVREKAGIRDPRPIRVDPDTSAGCAVHARYLDRHRAQLAAWPDAHEEYPDREGFAPEGARAGLASVIAPGVSGPEEAVAGWMGTYFHRLPLLDPGLLRIGFALEKNIAVLDSGSFVAPAEHVLEIVWPPDGAEDVPLSFQPEIPHPFPGRDQSRWGYPITVQLFQYAEIPTLSLALLLDGKEPVPALVSTPAHPGNPELAPSGAYALIPESRLRPKSTYVVQATGFAGGKSLRWSFRTASR